MLNYIIPYVDGQEAVEVSDAWLERSGARPGRFKRHEIKNTNSEKESSGMVEVGAERRRSEPI